MKLELLFIIWYITHSIHANQNNLTNSKITKKAITCSTKRIVGGEDAREGFAPYQCSLQRYNIHLCGCAVINPKFVLTASHCLMDLTTKRDIVVMVGSTEVKSGGTYYDVELVVLHEDYGTPKRANDVALAKVKEPIQYTDKVQPIELEDKEVPGGSKVRLTGWGRLTDSGDLSRKLQYINLYILGLDRCRISKVNTTLYDSMICTNGCAGKGACDRDSGGPLVHDNKLVGIVNFGYKTCAFGEPDVYAKISSFVDWIKIHSSLHPLNKDECYRDDDDVSNFIAGGKTAPDGLAPFQCSLQYFGKHRCGCAVIDPHFVLTASNCIVNRTEDRIRIMVGSDALGNGKNYEAKRLIPHEHYDAFEYTNDIALVEVKGPIQFNEKVQPIELGVEEVPVGAEVQLTGWGYERKGYTPNRLQYVNSPILDRNVCIKANSGRYIQDQHFCTLNLSGKTCEADNGGPLVYENKVVGIVNFRRPCCKGHPDVYANVSYFADWITKHSSTRAQ